VRQRLLPVLVVVVPSHCCCWWWWWWPEPKPEKRDTRITKGMQKKTKKTTKKNKVGLDLTSLPSSAALQHFAVNLVIHTHTHTKRQKNKILTSKYLRNFVAWDVLLFLLLHTCKESNRNNHGLIQLCYGYILYSYSYRYIYRYRYKIVSADWAKPIKWLPFDLPLIVARSTLYWVAFTFSTHKKTKQLSLNQRNYALTSIILYRRYLNCCSIK